MNIFKDVFKKEFSKKLAGKIFTIGLTILTLFYYLLLFVMGFVIENITAPFLIHLLVIGTLLIIIFIGFTIFTYIAYRNEKKKSDEKDPLKEYDVEIETGALIHKENKFRYCQSCFHRGVSSILSVYIHDYANGSRLECVNQDCKASISFPDSIAHKNDND